MHSYRTQLAVELAQVQLGLFPIAGHLSRAQHCVRRELEVTRWHLGAVRIGGIFDQPALSTWDDLEAALGALDAAINGLFRR